ncbi:MAG: uracil-DNA glycosylase [Rhodothermales bacterium]
MLLQPVWDIISRDIFPLPSSAGLFNPYNDRNDAYDVDDAIAIRRNNFKSYLGSYTSMPRLFLLAEAPGPWGCRFSGVPLVSESQLEDNVFPIHGKATSLADEPHSEYTAKIYWRVLGPYFPQFFTWNSVPFHPYKEDKLMSIRNPGNREVLVYTEALKAIVDVIKPERVLSIGRKAEYAFSKIDVPCTYIRHPSQGGARKFEEGINEVLREMQLI